MYSALFELMQIDTKVQRKEVKTQQVVICNNVVN